MPSSSSACMLSFLCSHCNTVVYVIRTGEIMYVCKHTACKQATETQRAAVVQYVDFCSRCMIRLLNHQGSSRSTACYNGSCCNGLTILLLQQVAATTDCTTAAATVLVELASAPLVCWERHQGGWVNYQAWVPSLCVFAVSSPWSAALLALQSSTD